MTYVCNTISENTGCYVEFSPFYFIFNYLFLIVTINFDVEIALFIVQSITLNLSLKCKIFVMLLKKQNGDITYLPLLSLKITYLPLQILIWLMYII